jgi:NADP-dependent 3-hydroxy acid dehydrogenase YdfG
LEEFKMRLENKVVVVTGASSGVGREVALRFAKEGAKVVAVARRAERLAALEEQSKELAGEIVAFAGDILSSIDFSFRWDYCIISQCIIQ